jgi:uncharacterized protein (TIGR02001 family)
LLALALLCPLATPASAQAALTLAVESDYRFRGFSLSEGRPVAIAQVAYDHRSGAYLNGAVIGVLRRNDADVLGYQANAGFATRLSPAVSLDAGLVHSEYRYSYLGHAYSRRYTEAYVGANVHDFTARVSYAPHYFEDGVSTLYGELEAGFVPGDDWRLSAHVGALGYVRTPHYFDDTTLYDWRLSAVRQFGAAEVHAALSGGGPGKEYYDGDLHNRTRITVGASVTF